MHLPSESAFGEDHKVLGAAGTSGAVESPDSAQGGAAAFPLMEIAGVYSGSHGFHKARGGWRKSPPNTDSKGENWCKHEISFFQQGLRNVLAEVLST